MRELLRREWLQLLVLILPFFILPLAWPNFPEHVPTHRNAYGEINGWMTKGIGFFFMMLILPGINIGMALLLAYLPKIDPKYAKAGAGVQAMRPIRLITTSFLFVLFVTIVAASAGATLDMSRIPEILILLFFFALGWFIAGVKSNYFVGIRLPWTLEDPENWRKTHHFAGRIWTIVSMLGIIADMLYPHIAILFTTIAINILAPVIYSFVLFKNAKSRTTTTA